MGEERIPSRVRHLLNVESGPNDGLAVPFVVGFLAWAGHPRVDAVALGAELAAGVALGIAVPLAAVMLEARRAPRLRDAPPGGGVGGPRHAGDRPRAGQPGPRQFDDAHRRVAGNARGESGAAGRRRRRCTSCIGRRNAGVRPEEHAMKSLTLVNVSQGFNTGIMPLGLASISAYLKQHGYTDIRFLDSNCQDIYRDYTPTDCVGISSVSQDAERAVRFARFVKGRGDTPIVLGGVHISTHRKLPEPFDVGVIGEGEQTMLDLMRLDGWSDARARAVPGVCWREGGETRFAPPRPLIEPLDQLPLPDRELANLDHYLRPQRIIPFHTGRSMTLLSSRGCPFRCVFCSTKVHWRKFRGFSAERVLAEMELLIERYRVEIIHLFDDLFIADKRRFAAIHAGVVARGYHRRVKFMCLVRSDMLDDATMQMLKEMNVVVTGIGMESGNDEVLRYLKQGTTTVAENAHAIELSTRYGIPTMGTFMVGNPHESEAQMIDTLRFIQGYRENPYFAPLTYIATTFPGTPFWELAQHRGIPVDAFDRIAMDIPDSIERLATAPLLCEIPLDRFFRILQALQAETVFGTLKQQRFEAAPPPPPAQPAPPAPQRLPPLPVRGVGRRLRVNRSL